MQALILPTTSRYLDFPSLVAFSSSHPSLSWLWPDFYDFTVSRNMLKVKDAADVVLMNNFLADFPVEEVGPYYKTCRAMIVFNVHKWGKCVKPIGEIGGDMEGRWHQAETTQRQASVQGVWMNQPLKSIRLCVLLFIF